MSLSHLDRVTHVDTKNMTPAKAIETLMRLLEETSVRLMYVNNEVINLNLRVAKLEQSDSARYARLVA